MYSTEHEKKKEAEKWQKEKDLHAICLPKWWATGFFAQKGTRVTSWETQHQWLVKPLKSVNNQSIQRYQSLACAVKSLAVASVNHATSDLEAARVNEQSQIAGFQDALTTLQEEQALRNKLEAVELQRKLVDAKAKKEVYVNAERRKSSNTEVGEQVAVNDAVNEKVTERKNQ